MAASVKALLEKRANIVAQARKINDEHAVDGVLPAEHQQAFDAAMKEAGDVMTAAKRLQSLETAEASLGETFDNAVPGGNPGASFDAKGGDGASEFVHVRSHERNQHGRPTYAKIAAGKRGGAAYRAAFSKALRHGVQGLQPTEFAALRSDDNDQAGYLTASEQWAAGVLQTVDDINFVRQFATIHTMVTADSLGIRKRTAKAATFNWSSELAISTEDSTLAYGAKVLTPHHLTGLIKVSRDLLKRSVEPVDAIVRAEMARDANEKMEDGYLLGHGAGQPLGVFVASTDGISTARDVLTGSATTFTADQLVAAKYTLKQQYRNGGPRAGARWLFHRDGISKISQLKDGDNHYMLQPARGLTGDEWDTLLGYPVDESERCPNTFTAGLYVGLLANWRYYEIADALDMEVQVLDQLYAATNQIGYIGRLKTDGLPTLEEAFVRLKTSP
jgi:HK97 family phage major capsid protein